MSFFEHATNRATVLKLAESNHIPIAKVEEALTIAGGEASREEWREFILFLCRYLGLIALASGIIFFFAYNWEHMGKLMKFALLQVTLVGTCAFIWLRNPQQSKILTPLLCFLFLLCGALLALFGQTYQTGADPWQLFSSWFFLCLPFVIFSRSSVLWIILFCVGQTAIGLHAGTFRPTLFGFHHTESLLFVLAITNLIAAVIFESMPYLIAKSGRMNSLLTKIHPDSRIPAQLCVFVAGGLLSYSTLLSLFGFHKFSGVSILFYIAFVSSCIYFYMRIHRDMILLAACALSLIIVCTGFLVKVLFESGNETGSFLLVSLAIIAQSTAAAFWLRNLVQEQNDKSVEEK